MSYQVINPEELGAPKGWNHGLLAPVDGQVLFVAGQIGLDPSEDGAPASFTKQFGRCLENILHVVRGAGGRPDHIGRMLIFVTDIDAYRSSLKELGTVWRQRMGRWYPAMALVEVTSLVDPRARVEIEATAVIPSRERLDGSPPRSLPT